MPFLYQTFYNFRNIKNDTIDLSSREVYFVGENGQGKSNILESLYCSAYGISFRTHVDSQMLRNGEKDFSLNSLFRRSENDIQKISVIYENGKKRIERNGRKIQDRKEIVNTVPCILFCHDDMKFATGGPEFRRFFIDQSLTLFDSSYIDELRNYRTVLKSRNLILKKHEYETLDAFDSQLVNFGLSIQLKRKKAVFQFNQIFGKLYSEITGTDGLSITYSPSWNSDGSETLDEMRSKTEEFLFLRRNQDKYMETTMSGPHRDRLNFTKDGKLFIPTASTGQCRLVSLLLRVAQAVFYKRAVNRNPVLLMDDVLLELDPTKRRKITAMLPEYDQLFCTFLPGEPYENYMRDTTRVYEISGGEWHVR